MKIVQQSAEILLPESPMRHIEKIGRLCYKSEDKIGHDSDKRFIRSLFTNGHHAMLEHYRFIMQVNLTVYEALSEIAPKHIEFSSYNDRLLISFNARTLMNLRESDRCMQLGYVKFGVKALIDELIGHIVREYDCHELFGLDRHKYKPLLSTGVEFIENSPSAMSAEEWNIHGWMSVHMVTDRGITHEIVRHREETSFAQESTRYCNYGKDKFGSEIMVIDQGFTEHIKSKWECAMKYSEEMYFGMINLGIKPQMARSVLPTCLKTEIVMTAPIYEWEHFFNLRMRGTTGAPHPMIKDLTEMIYEQYTGGILNEKRENKNKGYCY